MFSAVSDRVFTELDAVRIARLGDGAVPPTLLDDLDAGEVVPSTVIPADVVTMNSVVEVLDHASGRRRRYTVCYPGDADPGNGRISVLSPLGASLLGLAAGAEASWVAPSGERRAVTVVAVLFQPEASGDYVA